MTREEEIKKLERRLRELYAPVVLPVKIKGELMRTVTVDRVQSAKQRYDRLAQQKTRGSKRSFVTEIENLQIIIAWQAGEISEGVAAISIGVDRLALRTMRDVAIAAALASEAAP